MTVKQSQRCISNLHYFSVDYLAKIYTVYVTLLVEHHKVCNQAYLQLNKCCDKSPNLGILYSRIIKMCDFYDKNYCDDTYKGAVGSPMWWLKNGRPKLHDWLMEI